MHRGTIGTCFLTPCSFVKRIVLAFTPCKIIWSYLEGEQEEEEQEVEEGEEEESPPDAMEDAGVEEDEGEEGEEEGGHHAAPV